MEQGSEREKKRILMITSSGGVGSDVVVQDSNCDSDCFAYGLINHDILRLAQAKVHIR